MLAPLRKPSSYIGKTDHKIGFEKFSFFYSHYPLCTTQNWNWFWVSKYVFFVSFCNVFFWQKTLKKVMDVFHSKFNINLCKMDNESQKNRIFQIQFCGQNAKFDAWKMSVFPIYNEGFPRGASKCVRRLNDCAFYFFAWPIRSFFKLNRNSPCTFLWFIIWIF